MTAQRTEFKSRTRLCLSEKHILGRHTLRHLSRLGLHLLQRLQVEHRRNERSSESSNYSQRRDNHLPTYLWPIYLTLHYTRRKPSPVCTHTVVTTKKD